MENRNQFPADLEIILEDVLAGLGDGIITDRDRAYAVSIAYDRIRDALMENQQIWQAWQYIYWQRKYCSYTAVLHRLTDSLQEEYAERMAREFRRAMDRGQLCQSIFDPGQWRDIRNMVDSARGFTGTQGALRKVVRRLPRWARSTAAAVLRLVKK